MSEPTGRKRILLINPLPSLSRPLWGFVGRLSREPDERRWGRRAKAARAQ